MRMQRMTTRRWMIAAAGVALLITAGQTGRRWILYRKLASWHEQEEFSCEIQEIIAYMERTIADSERVMRSVREHRKRSEQLSIVAGEWEANPLAKQPVYLGPTRTVDEMVDKIGKKSRADRAPKRVGIEPGQAEKGARLLAAYHARLKEKYRRAASRPWKHVPPDPPPSQR